MPVGKYKKEQIRKIAQKMKLPVFAKKDSQEICFVPEKTPQEFLKRYLKLKPGDIITTEGKKIGRHKGIALYTIGQRKGLEMNAGPWYVAKIDEQKNQVVVTNDNKNPLLLNKIMRVKQVNWLQKVKLPINMEIRIRYGHKGERGTLSKKVDFYEVKFKNKQRAITSGQSAVFYQKNEVIGGGLIIK